MTINLSSSHTHSLFLPNDLTNLRALAISGLSSEASQDFRLPDGLKRLEHLSLRGNNLNRFTLPEGFVNLETLNLSNTQLTRLTLPEGLENLKELTLPSTLEQLTVPHGMDIYQLVPNPSFRIHYLLSSRNTQIGKWVGGLLERRRVANVCQRQRSLARRPSPKPCSTASKRRPFFGVLPFAGGVACENQSPCRSFG